MAINQIQADFWLWVVGAMKRRGCSDLLAQLIADMTAYETADYTSNVFLQNYNMSGIKFINKPIQKNAVKGTPAPASEGKTFYAKFASLDAWADDLIRIFRSYGKAGFVQGDGKFGIYATSAENKPGFTSFQQLAMRFAKILKMARYYGTTVDNYYKAIVRKQHMYNPVAVPYQKAKIEARNKDAKAVEDGIVQDARNAGKRLADQVNPYENMFNPAKWGMAQWGLVAAAVIILTSRR